MTTKLMHLIYLLSLLFATFKAEEDCADYGIDCPPTGNELTSMNLLALRWPFTHMDFNEEAVCHSDGITSKGHADGFGAQYAAMISVFAYSFEINVPYCHTPWTHLAHNNRSTMKKANNLFRFVGGHLLGMKAEGNITVILDAHQQMDTKYFRYPEVPQKIRAAYWAVPKPPLLYFKKEIFNLAVHIRRGDVGPNMDRKNQGRYTSDESLSRCLSKIVPNLRSQYKRDVGIHIFSEGSIDDFNVSLVHSNVQIQFHLNAGVALTFHHLVVADALVIAHSSFSITAAFVSIGRVMLDCILSFRCHSIVP
mmetsp:Transcript_18687/g.22947  ORF Transcript_18687/g.22947 Transcript_18687/m.22947 type:complete len:308 (-) Transcript_18687:340-1263(-)